MTASFFAPGDSKMNVPDRLSPHRNQSGNFLKTMILYHSNIKSLLQSNNITPKFQRLSLREKRNRELNVAKNIIERVRNSSPVQRRRVIKMMRELGFKPLNKP